MENFIPPQDFQDLISDFNSQTEIAKETLSKLENCLVQNKVPTDEMIDLFSADIIELRDNYDSIYKLTQTLVLDDEMPEYGNSVTEFLTAIQNSRLSTLKQTLERAKKTISDFLKVSSNVSAYTNAILPFQNNARNFLSQLESIKPDEAEFADKQTESYRIFLDALNEDIGSLRGFSLLQNISQFYPAQIQWGLASNNYYIDTPTNRGISYSESTSSDELKLDSSEDSNVNPEPELTDKAGLTLLDDFDNNENPVDELEENSDKKESESSGSKIIELSIADYPKDDILEVDEAIEEVEYLYVQNKIKTTSAKASSFKKELVNLSNTFPQVRSIIPLLSNLGVASEKQLLDFCCVMETSKKQNKLLQNISGAINILVSRGLLSHYIYNKDGENISAYSLSPFTYYCLNKGSVISKQNNFWFISFGNNKVCGEEKIEKQVVADYLRNNDLLSIYVLGNMEHAGRAVFLNIRSSIWWIGENYRVAVHYDDEVYQAILVNKNDVSELTAENLLVIDGEVNVDEPFNKNCERIFVYKDSEILEYTPLTYIIQKYTDSPSEKIELNYTGYDPNPEDLTFLDINIGDNDPSNLDEEKNSNTDSISKIINIDIADNYTSEESDTGKEPENTTAEENEFNSYVDVNCEKDTSKNINDSENPFDIDITPQSLLDLKSVPTDTEFCEATLSTLRKRFFSDEALKSAVVQSVLLAESGSYTLGKSKLNKLSGQLQLATHILLGKYSYSSKDLSELFPNPLEEENKSLMLAAYMFAMLTPTVPYDYGLKNQTDIFFSDFKVYFEKFEEFKPLFNKLRNVSNTVTYGFTPAVIAHLGSNAESENFINDLRRQARKNLIVPSPTTKLKSLPIFYQTCFGSNSELHECMEVIADNQITDSDSRDYVEAVLESYCDECNGIYRINVDKIHEAIDKVWSNVNTKKKMRLEYNTHNMAVRQYENRLTIMKNCVEHFKSRDLSVPNISVLKNLRNEIIEEIEKLKGNSCIKDDKNGNILLWMLNYMKSYLSGKTSNLDLFNVI